MGVARAWSEVDPGLGLGEGQSMGKPFTIRSAWGLKGSIELLRFQHSSMKVGARGVRQQKSPGLQSPGRWSPSVQVC